MATMSSTIRGAMIVVVLLLAAACGGGTPEPAASDGTTEERSPEATAGAEGDQYTIATFSLGSGFYAYGVVVSQLMESEAGIAMTPLPQAGGLSNAALLQEGEADLGFVFTPAAVWAWGGEAPFEEPHDRLRGIAGGLDRYYLGEIVAEGAPVESLQQAVDEEAAIDLVLLQQGTMGELVANRLLAAYGVDYDTIESWGGSVTFTTQEDMLARFADGRADVTIQPVTAGHPTFVELGVRSDVHYAPLPAGVAEQFTADAGFVPIEMPAGLFDGQDDPVATVSWTTVLLTTTELPDDVAYAVAEAMYGNPDRLAEGAAALGLFDPEEAASDANVPVPLHDGARAFYDSLTGGG
jgi:hypothetical protein